MTKIMRHCGYSNTLNIGYLNFQMKLKNSGQRKSQGTLLTCNADGGLGSMKANEIQYAKYEIVHIGRRLKIFHVGQDRSEKGSGCLPLSCNPWPSSTLSERGEALCG